ncbi:MAG: methyl-accepting chemotaxis protein [Moorellaceae bacterium]
MRRRWGGGKIAMGKLAGSLRLRMTVLFGLIVLLGCLVLSLVSQNRAGSALEGEARDALLKVARQAADTVDSRIQARMYVVGSIANNSVIRGKWGDREATLQEKVQALNEELKFAEGVGFKQLDMADRQGNALLFNANIGDRSYFQAALGGKTAVSSSLMSKRYNIVTFIFATPVRHYATNEITGVLFGEVDGATFSGLISSITYGRTGYAFAVDNTGKIIAHQDAEKVKAQENILEQAKTDPSLASLAEVVSKMVQGGEGVASYALRGQEYLIAYAPVKATGWSVAVTAPKAEVLERNTGLKQSMLLVSLGIIVLVLVLTYAMARTITTPLVLLVEHLGLIADGDFTQPVPQGLLARGDEIGRLVQAVERLRTGMWPLLTAVKEYAGTLVGNSETLTTVSEEIASSSGEVAKAIQQVAAGASEQAGHLQEILGLVENITASLEKVYTELGQVRANSEETSRLAGLGKRELDVLVTSIKTAREAFKVVAEKLTGLRGSVNQVGEILEVINGIAEQTNLLALNAAIEAARAGEAGRGFAVVADEVRKLAEESRTSSDKIRALLNGIAAETQEVVHTSEEVGRQVVGQLENVEKTVKAFDDILEAVAAMAPMIEATYREVDGTAKAKDVVLERVQSISAVAEETSASAQEISASAEEVSASTEEIAANAQQVLEVAKRLEEEVERFKV